MAKSPKQQHQLAPVDLTEQEERKREEEYLMRKYKRRFAPYNANNSSNGHQTSVSNMNGNGDVSVSGAVSAPNGGGGLDSNLYLLASSRQHHRPPQSNGIHQSSNGSMDSLQQQLHHHMAQNGGVHHGGHHGGHHGKSFKLF